MVKLAPPWRTSSFIIAFASLVLSQGWRRVFCTPISTFQEATVLGPSLFIIHNVDSNVVSTQWSSIASSRLQRLSHRFDTSATPFVPPMHTLPSHLDRDLTLRPLCPTPSTCTLCSSPHNCKKKSTKLVIGQIRYKGSSNPTETSTNMSHVENLRLSPHLLCHLHHLSVAAPASGPKWASRSRRQRLWAFTTDTDITCLT